MEEYLRKVQSRLGADATEDPIHAVLGGPEPDVDTVAATLCLALHLSQKETTGGVCLPVLCSRLSDTVLPAETVRYLQSIKISVKLLLWKDDVDFLKLHHAGKLTLTLLRDGLLDSHPYLFHPLPSHSPSSEYHTLESSILRVVHHDGQQDAGDDGASSAMTTVTREILQEAAEHIKASLGETLGEALRLQSEVLWIKHGRQSTQLEELKRSLEQWSDITAGPYDEVKLKYLEQLLTMELKEFSDGEMTLALSSVNTDKEDLHGYVDGLKSFSHQHGYDGLVLLLSISDSVHHPRQQVVVYSNNKNVLNQWVSLQICSELEESSSWSLSAELETRESVQVYHIPINTSSSILTSPLLGEEIQSLLKDFVDRRSTILACHPSSRTSSTEGVAGSVEFSQGSSGINDMDGSDIERAEGGSGVTVGMARAMADGEEDTGGVGVSVGGEPVSPDSGMTTIRSSRSSKESSVFLSDDSPVGDVLAGGGHAGGPGGLFLRNPSPLGLSSLSPPVPPERKKHRSNRSRIENIDLFSFDPLHTCDKSMPAGREAPHLGEREDEGKGRGGSSSLSELEELRLLDFSASNSLGELESTNSSINHHGQIHGNEVVDTVVPPTPVNSLVGSRPPSSCGVRFFPEDVVERINGLQHKDSVSSSLSETWDELGFDTQGAFPTSDSYAWNRTTQSVSPQNIVEDAGGNESVVDITKIESTEDILKSENSHQRAKSLEPQLSLIAEQTESYDNWNPESILKDQWNPVTLTDLQLMPPEDESTTKGKASITGVKEKLSSLSRKKATLNTLTPETSKEEDEGPLGKKGDRQMGLLDFWTYSAQKGFLKSDSGTTTSYPESLDMWNMTIRDDSLSPLTTPDNLSENSGSFCGLNSNVLGATSVESPLGFSDGGMEMWNTTIREDSSSTIASPEGPENVKEFSDMGSLDASECRTRHASKQDEGVNAIEEEKHTSIGIIETPEEEWWRDNEQNVKIVIEEIAPEGKTQGEETGNNNIQSVHSQESVTQNLSFEPSEDETSTDQCNKMWDLPIPGMVSSTSEYDNVGAGVWSVAASPEHYAGPAVHMIQLDEQSSPFMAVTKPVETCTLENTEYRSVISEEEQPAKQMFLFEGTSEFCHMTRSGQSSVESNYDNKSSEGSVEADWMDHSPFVVVDCSSTTRHISTLYHSSPEKASETKIPCDQSSSQSSANWNNAVSEKHDASASGSSSHELLNKTDHSEHGPAIESHGCSNKEGNVEAKITETMSLSSSSGGERDTLKYSPDSIHPGSRDELRSNSDGDSSSGLEMEYIIVSGTVKEAEREWHDRPKKGDSQSKGTRKPMETFSTLSYAATVLQTHAQDAHREFQDNADQSRQTITTTDSAHSANTTEQHMVLKSPIQSKNYCEAAGHSQTQIEERNYDSKSSIMVRSVSPSLRYPVDHFLKTREEVYVHSQISMEDSDEGGQSPSAPPPCSTSLGDFQVWEGQLVKQDTPQTASETHSPVLTNSSVSHNSSPIGTPLSESGVSADKSLGLPFSGDLMEEENDIEDQEEETDRKETTVPKWISETHSEGEERQELASPDLLSFTEEVIGSSSVQQRDIQTVKPKQNVFPEKTVNYYNPVWTVGLDKRLAEQKIGDHEASQDTYSQTLRGRCQDDTSQQLSQPVNENAAYQWTGSQTVSQGQTQYGYNYHHIDQRTENQSGHSNEGDGKFNSQQNTTDVYAEFTTDATTVHYRSEQAENYYEAGFNTEYSLDYPGCKFQNTTEIHYGDDSNSTRVSQLQFPQYEADDRSPCETNPAHYQFDGHSFHQPDVQPESEDHAQYVPEGYVHFLLSRQSQQALGPAGMKVASSEDTAEETDNREASGESNQRRKLTAPPISVSLDRSEGSVLSEDALDTENDALDTGDDLDLNIDEQDTPDEADSLEFNTQADSLGAEAASIDAIASHGAAVESRDSKLWRSVVIGDQEHRIDMKCIEPYKRVISHGGYYAEQNAIIVFAACFLPDSDCTNYNYVMENLFLYVISTLELMVAEDYMIVYLNGATPHRRMPGFTWMKKCYQMIDRRLKKNLKMFIIVHPSWFIRTLLGITRPFISSKFSSKIKYVNSLQELGEIIPMEYVHIPPSIVKYDEERGIHKFACMRLDTDLQDTTAKADKKRNSAV
ncbi:uncharacterized protein [Channa argus]|uniref:uncharacterized protein isoform X4 n=1 Tax=Channa argus TaxID=215402 RepID=UPI003521F35C